VEAAHLLERFTINGEHKAEKDGSLPTTVEDG
jgi:hypothetical protein